MRNSLLFGTIFLISATAMAIGVNRLDAGKTAAEQLQPAATEQIQIPLPVPRSATAQLNIPYIGSVQVLNGCGTEGAANRMADFLRSRNFDVKDISNAATFNYPATMIISRSTDMSLAKELERILRTGRVALVRTNEQLYDVTVITGPDVEERIR